MPLRMLPAVAEIGHLRERFHDVIDDAAPAPLADLAGGETAVVALESLRAQGGPSFAALRQALDEALQDAVSGGTDTRSLGEMATLGALFASLDARLRRPVEIFGLLQLAAQEPAVGHKGGDEQYVTVRADGSIRPVRVPQLAWQAQAAVLESPDVQAMRESASDDRLLADRVLGSSTTEGVASSDRMAPDRGPEEA